MSLAVREVSVVKGYDPRDFALVASGGAGPLHVLLIAAMLHVPTVIIPLFPSQFSALGMLMADERHDFIRTYFADLAQLDFHLLLAVYEEMMAEAGSALQQKHDVQYEIKLDLRYVGQEFTLPVTVTLEQLNKADRQTIRAAFDEQYDLRYAHHSPEEPVEMINLRLAVTGKRTKLNLPRLAPAPESAPFTERQVYLKGNVPVTVPVYRREVLGAGAQFVGPAIVQEDGTTTVLFEGDQCTVMETGELIIKVGEQGARHTVKENSELIKVGEQ